MDQIKYSPRHILVKFETPSPAANAVGALLSDLVQVSCTTNYVGPARYATRTGKWQLPDGTILEDGVVESYQRPNK